MIPLENCIQLEYIESDGTQYTDLLRTEVNGCKFECDIEYLSFNNNDRDWFLGSRINTVNWLVGYYNSSACFWRDSYNYAGTLSTNERTKLILNLQNLTFYNSIRDQQVSFATGDFSASPRIFIGNGTTFTTSPICRCYGVKHYLNGVLISNYIPVYDTLNKKAGLYDLISNNIIYSKTSNDFIAGPVKRNVYVKINDNWKAITSVFIKKNGIW